MSESIRIDESENIGVNTSTEPSIGELIGRRLSRRGAMRGLAAAGATAALAESSAQAAGPSTLTFREIAMGMDETHHVPEGYEAQTLIRWGDPVLSGAPAFEVDKLTGPAQEKQFGYNCDFIGLHPLPRESKGSDRFLMCV